MLFRTLLAAVGFAVLAACKPSDSVDDAAPHIVGVVEAVDPAAGTITIAHEAVEALGWPAMTMPFKVTRLELLDDVAIGERVELELERLEMTAPVASLRKAR